MRLITLLTLLVINVALADEYKVEEKNCSAVDVRDHHPKLKKHFSTPQDQDSIGWCYGYAAADLLSVETGSAVSAIHVSSIFNKKVASNTFWKLGYSIGNLFMDNSFNTVYEGGFIKSAIEDSMDNLTVCSDENLPYYTMQSYEIKSLIHLLEEMKKNISEKTLSNDQLCAQIKNEFPDVENKDQILASLMNDDLNVSVEKIIRENCKNNLLLVTKKKVRDLHKPQRNIGSRGDPTYSARVKQYLQKVNSTLSKGKPLGISYNVKHVTFWDGNHASTVLARRWHNGRCEYKIRNSWGQSCPYEDIECNYDEGTFWVNDEKFFNMAINLTLIDD